MDKDMKRWIEDRLLQVGSMCESARRAAAAGKWEAVHETVNDVERIMSVVGQVLDMEVKK